MHRREFLRTAGVLTVAVASGGAVATRAFAGGEASVQQIVRDGTPQPTSVLSVPLARPAEPVDGERITTAVPVVDPLTGTTERRSVPVRSVTATGRTLRLVIAGPASRGTVVSFGAGAVRIDGESVGAFALRLGGSLDHPERATQWFKSYTPTEIDLFDDSVYHDATPGVRKSTVDDETVVRARLRAYLERFVERGRLDVARVETAMARFDDPTVRERFTTEDGEFAPDLLAGLLATAGTVARSVEQVVLDGDNVLGEPYTVSRQQTPSGGLMEVRIYDGDPMIVVDPRLRGEPLAVLAALFAHEGLHQDLSVGLDEEIVATYLETLVWAEQLLADPTLARRGTRGVKRANRNLLVALNSGRLGFPDIGLRTAPRRGDDASATPGADEPIPDFVSIVEAYYRGTAPVTSPGVPYARRLVSRVIDRPVGYITFDEATVDRLDRETRLFSPDEVVTLLSTLRLRPVAPTNAAPDNSASETAPTDRAGEAVRSDAGEVVRSDSDGVVRSNSDGPARFETGGNGALGDRPDRCGTWLAADGDR